MAVSLDPKGNHDEEASSREATAARVSRHRAAVRRGVKRTAVFDSRPLGARRPAGLPAVGMSQRGFGGAGGGGAGRRGGRVGFGFGGAGAVL
jgi:hypothetical protein